MRERKDVEKVAIVRLASSQLGIDELLKAIGKIDGTVQLFDSKNTVSKRHIIAAYENARSAFENKTNISKSMAMETLLFAAMTRQVGEAIKIMGAKSNKEFAIFADSQSTYEKMKALLSSSSDFVPSEAHTFSAAKIFGITDKKKLDSLLLQKIAMSRLDA